MAHPGSALATHAWLLQRSVLGELIGCGCEAISLNRLYSLYFASDALYKHREAMQDPRSPRRNRFSASVRPYTLYRPDPALFRGLGWHRNSPRRGPEPKPDRRLDRTPADALLEPARKNLSL